MAAIAGDYKDFKFRNDTEVPIYIEGGVYSGTIYFNIYGEETRSDDREVTFESETTQTMQPGADKITYDKTKPASYTKVTQEAHVGYKAVLWKIVKENGKTKKTQINSSTYQAVPRYVTKGAAEGTPATPAASAKPQTTKKATKEPKATAKPKKTAKPMATVNRRKQRCRQPQNRPRRHSRAFLVGIGENNGNRKSTRKRIKAFSIQKIDGEKTGSFSSCRCR